MNGLPVVRPRELIRALERVGFVVHHIRGTHYYLRHPAKPGLLVTVPYHNRDLKRGTLRSILRQAGITPEELRNSVNGIASANQAGLCPSLCRVYRGGASQQ